MDPLLGKKGRVQRKSSPLPENSCFTPRHQKTVFQREIFETFPLPLDESWQLCVTCVAQVNKNAKLMEAMALLRQQIGFDDETERLVVCEVFHHSVYRWLADTTSTSSLKDTDTVVAFR